MKYSNTTFFAILSLTLNVMFCHAQNTEKNNVIVDNNGVMRWENTKEEIKGFGTNYTVPFAHAFRSAKKMGVDPLKAIDEDVYHFARLGFDFYRVHVWDTEISDTLGNVLYNEHLHAFDYLLHKLSERNINYIITPIAFWGNGWPEPDEPTPGFSAKYGKDACLVNPDAIQAQENYLFQFMNHINPYKGVAYKDDPNLIAMEISNEPHHRESPEKVTEFIQGMVESVRRTGYTKPIFYNVSHSVHLMENYFAAGIQGGTFQWYPTGLGYQGELQENILPNVDNYLMPFDDIIKKKKGAKIVYEFDTPDIGKSYGYPAMARSFREAGIQVAAQFAYDPMFTAYANTEYNTHHMNLAYTPQKALALKICSEIFHELPLNKDYGSYPENTAFEDFMVSYEKDLAIYNSGEKYYYTNHTSSTPKNESALKHVAGYGNSPLIEYDGTGAYFLDKLDDGNWRLEVMPDAMVVDNPYGRNSLKKEVAIVQWNDRIIKIKLKDLGENLNIFPINEGNDFNPSIAGNQTQIRPGVYVVSKKNMSKKYTGSESFENIRLNEFYAPKSNIWKTYLVHHQPNVAIAGERLKISAEIATPNPSPNAQVVIGNAGGGVYEMKNVGGFDYEVTIDASKLKKGFLRYYIIVKNGEETETFPAGEKGYVWDWDFSARSPYVVRVIEEGQPIYLFDAQKDYSSLSWTRWMNTLQLVPSDHIGESEYQVNVEELFRPDAENLNASPIYDYTVKGYVNNKIDAVHSQLSGKNTLILKARSMNDKPVKIQVALAGNDGSAFGKIIELKPQLGEYRIKLSELKKVLTVTMPRPYPTFLPYYFTNEETTAFQVEDMEGFQISIGPGIPKSQLEEKHGVAIVSLRLSND